VRGAPKILDKAEQILGIKAGETTKDMKFSLERVNCLGCCALGPVIVVDEEAHGNLTTANVEEVFKKYE
jgi:NADH-quinone oxidoreductase subunit E